MKKREMALYGLPILLLAVLVGQQWLHGRALRDVALYADSVEAAADTARLVLLDALDDSTNAWQRRIIQTRIERDSLDRELAERPVVRISAGVRVDTLRFVDTVPVAPSMENDSTRRYEWWAEDAPFTVQAVTLLRPDWTASFTAEVIQSSPIEVGLRVGCQPGPEGVYAASVLMVARDPLSLVPGRVTQDPEVCNPETPFISFDFGWKNAALFGGGSILLWELVRNGFRLPW